jgi:uncharacterized protein YecT (DUF1311 family)
MQKMNTKILSLILFALSFLISAQSRAFDCSKSTTKTEKLICKKESLVKMDEEYNSTYNEVIRGLSSEGKEALKSKIKNLLSARDSCVRFSQKSSDSKKSAENFLSEPFKSYKIKQENFAQGCIATWYNSISKAFLSQKDSGLFRIPSSEEYLKEFNKLKEKPYLLSISEIDQDMVKNCKEEHKDEPNFDCSYMQNQYSAELTYAIFFPNNHKNFIQITKNSYSYLAGAAHGQSLGSSKFITEKGETREINNSAYSCSIPLKDPVAVNGDVYLPEQISFTKFFNGMLGEFDEFQCYACSGSYRADCLMRLSKIDNNKDSYIVFNSQDFAEDPIPENDKISPKDFRKCAFDVIKKNQNDSGEIRSLVKLENGEPVIIKGSPTGSILTKIKKDCQKYGQRKEQCLKLNSKSPSFEGVITKIAKTKLVKEFAKLLEKDHAKLNALNYNPEFQNNKCYWSIRLHEDRKSHMVFWKELLVEVDGNKVFEKDGADDSLKEVK